MNNDYYEIFENMDKKHYDVSNHIRKSLIKNKIYRNYLDITNKSFQLFPYLDDKENLLRILKEIYDKIQKPCNNHSRKIMFALSIVHSKQNSYKKDLTS